MNTLLPTPYTLHPPAYTLLPTPYTLLLPLLILFTGSAAFAHPMGNFSINHYSRLDVESGKLKVRYILDFAEIPTVTERSNMDVNHNGVISEAEKNNYLQKRGREIAGELVLSVNGKIATMNCAPSKIEFLPGAGGLQTMRLTLLLTADPVVDSTILEFEYKDTNFAERTGWKEIVTTASQGVRITKTTGALKDTSRELTLYPVNALIPQPTQTEVNFTVEPGDAAGKPAATSGAAASTLPLSISSSSSSNSRTPQDAFTQAIARQDLSVGVIALSLGLAMLFGAFHALSPGHGKAMVAAYLVGSRGTIRHAILLGAIITVTHTIGVFALGLVTLAAAKYVLPERLYPILSGLSGLTIVIVGIALLWQRIHVSWDDDEGTGEAFDEDVTDFDPYGLSNESDNEPERENSVSLRSLFALGITGGILPCPSALVVMLSAIALHRIAFGMLLIVAFSAGLAVVLTAIGILIVRMRGWFDKLPIRGKLLQRLPIASAAIVTIIGLILIFRAFTGQS